MTQGVPVFGNALPTIARRSPSRYFVQSSRGNVSFATARVLGLWVPQEAFRRGTCIVVTGGTTTASAIFSLGIGGNAAAARTGVLQTFTTAPATTVGFRLTCQQETDGLITTFRTGGFFAGGTSLVVSTVQNTAVFLQPMNYVELSTGGTFTVDNVTIEVFPPQRTTQLGYQELLAV